MGKIDWNLVFGLVVAMIGAWLIYQYSKKTPTETFFYDTFEDIAEDDLGSAL